MFDYISLLKFRAVFAARGGGVLPDFLGSTIRGVFGHCMREFACRYQEETLPCHQCRERKGCLYALCFSSAGGEAGAVNPFVLYPLIQGKTQWREGDRCAFDLTVIGDMTGQSGIFLHGLRAMETKGWGAARIPFALEHILDPTSGRILYAGSRVWNANIRSRPFTWEPRKAKSALVQFDTPVRVVHSQELCQSLDFETLIRFISRRVALLTKAYTDQILEWDESLYTEAARVRTVQEEWRSVPFTRYSMTQKGERLDLPAITGWALYEGDLEPFVPILEVGALLQVGKNTTHGFGHYTVSYDQ